MTLCDKGGGGVKIGQKKRYVIVERPQVCLQFLLLLLLLQPQLLQIHLFPANFDYYCNSLYSGISQTNLNKLQRIQNSLAHVITIKHFKISTHHTNTQKLHLLPNKQRIDYKICLLTVPSHSVSTRFTRIYQDLPGSIHEDTIMDGHRQGKKANAHKYPLTFLK